MLMLTAKLYSYCDKIAEAWFAYLDYVSNLKFAYAYNMLDISSM